MAGFKIKKEEYVNKTFRLKKSLIDSCSQIAADKDISLNEFVSQSLQFALDSLVDENEEE